MILEYKINKRIYTLIYLLYQYKSGIGFNITQITKEWIIVEKPMGLN